MEKAKPDCNGRVSKLDAAIEQINGMGWAIQLLQRHFDETYAIAFKPNFSKVSEGVTGKTIEEAVLNLLDKLKTQKELG